MFRNASRIAPALLLALLSPVASAAPADDARQVAPFVDEQTLAVIRIDLDKLDVNAAAEWAAKLPAVARDGGPAAQKGIAAMRDQAQAGVDALRKAKASRVFV